MLEWNICSVNLTKNKINSRWSTSLPDNFKKTLYPMTTLKPWAWEAFQPNYSVNGITFESNFSMETHILHFQISSTRRNLFLWYCCKNVSNNTTIFLTWLKSMWEKTGSTYLNYFQYGPGSPCKSCNVFLPTKLVWLI